ncbi:MAG: TonB-dependent receptor [Pseudomonadota bacterium]
MPADLFAKESLPTSEEDVEVILVTGTKLNQTQKDIGSSISVFNASRIATDNIINIEDIFDRTANAFTGVTGFGAYSIRGIKNTNVIDGFNSTNALSTLVVNGLPLGLSAADYLKPSLFDASGVEILRGPQSVAQGPNSLIGSIVINYNQPSFSGYESLTVAEYGNMNSARFATAQNLVLANDVLAARVIYENRQSDGDVTNITTGQDDVQRIDEEMWRGQVRFRPTGNDDLTFDLTLLRNRSDSNPFANITSDAATGRDLFDRIQTSDVAEEYPSDFDLFSLQANWKLNDTWSLTAITGVGDFDSRQKLDGDLTEFPLFELQANYQEKLTSHEFRFNYEHQVIKGLIGVFYSDGEYFDEFILDGVFPDGEGGFIPFDQTQGNEQGIEQLAIFANVDVQITDKLAANLGLRFNAEERQIISSTDQFGDLISFTGEADFDQLLPSVSIRYSISEQSTIGALYSRGYQGGGFAAALALGEVRPYEEEFIDNYELFFRFKSDDNRWSIYSNLFYFDWRDQQVPFTPANGFPGLDEFIANAGASRVYGFEIEANWRVNSSLEIFSTMGLSDTKFEEFTVDGMDLSGSAFPGSPKWNFALGGVYRYGTGLYASGTFSYVDETYTELGVEDFTAISNRTLLSGRVGYEFENWTVYIYGENLLDKNDELGLFDRRVIGVSAPLGTVAPGRAVGAGVEFNW